MKTYLKTHILNSSKNVSATGDGGEGGHWQGSESDSTEGLLFLRKTQIFVGTLMLILLSFLSLKIFLRKF